MSRTPLRRKSKSVINEVKEKGNMSIKDKCWSQFSIYIRTRDCLLTTGCAAFGFCITCGKRYHFKLLQAGHFIPGRHLNNLFSEKGTHAQCYNCNINLKGNTLEYRRRIIKMYGEGFDEVLEKEAQKERKFQPSELEELIVYYKKQIHKLGG